jgi:hypothetical protein
VLDTLRSNIDRWVLDFKEQCKTELTTREQIKSFVLEQMPENIINLTLNEHHLTHAIDDADMISTTKRITFQQAGYYSKKTKARIVIVKGNWTREMVQNTDEKTLRKVLGGT